MSHKREKDETMNCRTCQRLIPEYVDDALRPGVRRRLERHVATCPACAGALACERTAPARFAEWLQPGLEERRLAPEARARLAAVARSSVSAPPAPVAWPGWSRPLAAAAVLLILLGAIGICRHAPDRSRTATVSRQIVASPAANERTNILNRFILIACASNAPEGYAVNTVYRASL